MAKKTKTNKRVTKTKERTPPMVPKLGFTLKQSIYACGGKVKNS